jgi:hypothetical protein
MSAEGAALSSDKYRDSTELPIHTVPCLRHSFVPLP